MFGIRGFLYLTLGVVGAAFGKTWLGNAKARSDWPTRSQVAVGFVTDFLDTLGVGSFAVTASLYRSLRLVPDRLIPGTLLVGHTLPTVAEAFIYITIIEVEMPSLVLLIAAAVAGSYLGAGVVAGLPKRKIQIGMGAALLGAAALILARLMALLPAGGNALGLHGPRLAAGMGGNFILGALMTIGIGAFAPSLILFGLLGMNTKAIFPIMMGSCALLMPVGGIQFLRRGSFAPAAALGLTLGGIPGVLVAAFLIKGLPLDVVRWVVLAVVVYTAAAMLRTAAVDTDKEPA